ncbi:MAG TPA: chorismate-binding protein [Planctomycetota bacterium]|nr:chorismate-binding protein [Planctomycetota bacterium]
MATVDARRTPPLIRRLPADLLTPLGALLRLGGDEAGADAFLFESVERGERVGRYSYVGVGPVESGALDAHAFRTRARHALGGGHPAALPDGAADGLPRFLGGLVFALGWDYARALEPRLGAPRGPVARAALFRDVVAFDHLQQEVQLVHNPGPGEPREEGEAILSALAARLDRPLPGVLARSAGGAEREAGGEGREAAASLDDPAFAAIVARAKEYIAAGDVFQVVLSRRFERATRASGLAIYRALRMVNPSPYMFYLRLGGHEWAGASPEMLLRVEGGEAMTHPIAGTRRRGASDAEDRALADELRADPKERAEHAMLVDLARNDLGRICDGGSVRLTRHMEVERFSHVMHLVSEVKGRLRPGVDALDALDACFPAGTVSGAPKVRAMEIIHELERGPRDTYAGAVGAASFTGTLDACIAIRMVEVEDGLARWQSGAGVVADSVPSREAEETREKAAGTLRAIARAEAEL